MSNKECGKLKDYTNTKYLYTLAENTPKVIYVQKRKLGKDKTHSRIRLESNRRGNIKKCVKVKKGGESFYIFLAEKTKKKGDATHGKEYR
jgi:hypothetical protein